MRARELGEIRRGQASYYHTEACRWNPDPRCPTASGESLYSLLQRQVPYAAMWEGRFGSRWRVTGSHGSTEVVLLDRGPAKRLGRLIDLNPESFRAVCGELGRGVCEVTVEAIE